MRTLLPLALVVVTVLLLSAHARGEDPAEGSGAPLEARVDLLARETAYLRVREAKLTSYVLANGARGEALERLVAELRSGGFASAANPSGTRDRLLQGLTALAESLKAGLPALSQNEQAMLANLPK
jgi:hypothetical protein